MLVELDKILAPATTTLRAEPKVGVVETPRIDAERQAADNLARWLATDGPRAWVADRLTGFAPKDRDALRTFAGRAASARWNEDSIKESMVSLTKSGSLPVETSRFFRDLYLVLLGSEQGPRAAPFLAVLEKDWVLRRLKEATK